MAKSLAHSKWVCNFSPKYRRKIIYYELRKDIQQYIRDLCKWKGVEIIEEDDAGPCTSAAEYTAEV